MSKDADTPPVPTCLFDAIVAAIHTCLYLPSALNAFCWAIDLNASSFT
jgi:hypothetical protein